MCTCTVLTFISWSLTGLYLITRSTCLAFRPDILDFKIVCLSIQRKKILFVTNYAQLSILKLFSAVLSMRTPASHIPFSCPLVRQRRHWHNWHSRHTCTCVIPSHSCPMMYATWKGFHSLEVMLFFFYPEYEFLLLDFFCKQNFAFSLGEC